MNRVKSAISGRMALRGSSSEWFRINILCSSEIRTQLIKSSELDCGAKVMKFKKNPLLIGSDSESKSSKAVLRLSLILVAIAEAALGFLISPLQIS